jgi:hypothetical protein
MFLKGGVLQHQDVKHVDPVRGAQAHQAQRSYANRKAKNEATETTDRSNIKSNYFEDVVCEKRKERKESVQRT